jgi:hypothetical protein
LVAHWHFLIAYVILIVQIAYSARGEPSRARPQASIKVLGREN